NALGSLGERSALEGLCGLINDPDRDVRETAIAALAQLRDPRAIVPLVLAMLDPESSVRAAAASTLSKLDKKWEKNEGIRAVVPKILQARESADYWVQHSAIKLLETLKIDPANPPQPSLSAPTAALPHPALAILINMLSDRDRDFRLAAVVALG